MSFHSKPSQSRVSRRVLLTLLCRAAEYEASYMPAALRNTPARHAASAHPLFDC